jgi:2-C-methyl-D-erythritol 4-phosphate cytidylyltransferase/2-C-methyl-D-erythritol 2,4-cyclodiphosphate synthase
MAAAGFARPKQFLEWRGVPLYWHSARTLSRCARLAGILFVFPADCPAEEAARTP